MMNLLKLIEVIDMNTIYLEILNRIDFTLSLILIFIVFQYLIRSIKVLIRFSKLR